MLQFIEDNLLKLQPHLFMTDWEEAQRKALKRIFPTVDVRGCWFHYTRAFIRRRQKLGITFNRLLKNNENALMVYKSLQQIPLLPPERIIDGYNAIKQKAEADGLIHSFKDMFEYFEKVWLNVV